MSALRVVGDVHGQLGRENLDTRDAIPYLETIAGAAYSVQVGDVGDAETYAQLLSAQFDADRHRFFPGNHDHHGSFPPHCLSDFGSANCGGVGFFFVRSAASADRAILIQRGRELGRTPWFEQEELTDAEMLAAEQLYPRARPPGVLSHDAPTEIAQMVWSYVRSRGVPNPNAVFQASRTNVFLERLYRLHAPKLWAFGHHHHGKGWPRTAPRALPPVQAGAEKRTRQHFAVKTYPPALP